LPSAFHPAIVSGAPLLMTSSCGSGISSSGVINRSRDLGLPRLQTRADIRAIFP
jgi:hypothetical protein